MERDFYYFAQNDLLFAKEGLKGKFYDNAAAISAQAAEKFLKHILVEKMDIVAGDKLLSTHNLRILINKVSQRYGEFAGYSRDMSVLKDYYYTQRYPNDNYMEINEELAKEAVEIAEKIKKITDKILSE